LIIFETVCWVKSGVKISFDSALDDKHLVIC
jgi:hypothetical protein